MYDSYMTLGLARAVLEIDMPDSELAYKTSGRIKSPG
jgi:hypothetical protein